MTKNRRPKFDQNRYESRVKKSKLVTKHTKLIKFELFFPDANSQGGYQEEQEEEDDEYEMPELDDWEDFEEGQMHCVGGSQKNVKNILF